MTARVEREVYRTYRRGKGFSSYTDAGTKHAESDCRCWWCWKPVLAEIHDFFTCHDGMYETVVQYRKAETPSPDLPPSLFETGDAS